MNSTLTDPWFWLWLAAIGLVVLFWRLSEDWRKVSNGWRDNYHKASNNTMRAMAILSKAGIDWFPAKGDTDADQVKARPDGSPGPSDPQ